MAKQTDIEQRLQALEARQNMFYGGPINLPTTVKHPKTGAIMNVPTASVPSMGSTYGSGSTPAVDLADAQQNDPFGSAAANAATSQDNFANLVKAQNLTGGNTPTYDLSGLGLGNIDFSQIPGLAGVYNNANTQTNGDGVVLNVPGSDQDTTKNVTSNVTSNVTQNVTGGDPKLTPADSGDTEKKPL